MGLTRFFDVTIEVKGFQEAQDRNRRRIQVLKLGGIQGILQDATLELQRWAVFITPIWTGTWQSSHRIKMSTNQGMVFLTNNINPRTGTPVWKYAEHPEVKGQSHAVYQNTKRDAGPRVLQKAAKATAKKLVIS